MKVQMHLFFFWERPQISQEFLVENMRRSRAFGNDAEFAVKKIEVLAIDVGCVQLKKEEIFP